MIWYGPVTELAIPVRLGPPAPATFFRVACKIPLAVFTTVFGNWRGLGVSTPTIATAVPLRAIATGLVVKFPEILSVALRAPAAPGCGAKVTEI